MAAELTLAIGEGSARLALNERGVLDFVQLGSVFPLADGDAYWSMLRSQAEEARMHGVRVSLLLPLMWPDSDADASRERVAQAAAEWADEIVANSLGAVWFLSKLGLPCSIAAGDLVKCFCAEDARVLNEMGVSKVRLSFELPSPDIRAFTEATPIPPQITVHGRVTLGILQEFAWQNIGAPQTPLPLSLGQGDEPMFEVRGREIVSWRCLLLLPLLNLVWSAGVRSFLIDARHLKPDHARQAVDAYGSALLGLESGSISKGMLASLANGLQTTAEVPFCNGWLLGRAGHVNAQELDSTQE